MDLLNHPVGIISIILFIIAYAFVMTEEVTHLRKSKPVLFVAGIIWAMIAWVGVQTGDSYAVKKELMHAFDEFNQLMLFLLALPALRKMVDTNSTTFKPDNNILKEKRPQRKRKNPDDWGTLRKRHHFSLFRNT